MWTSRDKNINKLGKMHWFFFHIPFGIWSLCLHRHCVFTFPLSWMIFLFLYNFFFFLGEAPILWWSEMYDRKNTATNLLYAFNKCVCLWVWSGVRKRERCGPQLSRYFIYTCFQLVFVCVACLKQNLLPKLTAVAYPIREGWYMWALSTQLVSP